MEKKVKFYCSGVVYGRYWGGGEGAYSASKFSGNTKEEVIEQATLALKDGSLDSGMGYERLLGALLNIDEETTVELDGRKFTNTENYGVFIGDLNEEQQDFLLEVEREFY